MAKGDSNKAQNQIDYQGGTAQNNVNNLNQRNVDQYGQVSNLFGAGAQTNVNNYNDIQKSYDSFLQGMPNAGSLYSSFLGPKYTGASAVGAASPTADTAQIDPATDPVGALFQKYNVKDTGQGSGVTDKSYWTQKYNETKDPYYLGRLEDDLKGNGMDAFNPQTGVSGGGRGAAIDKAIAGYGSFADTGGFSPQDIANIRARSIAPIRSMADRNEQEIQRQAAIRGTAYSPNTAAAIAKTARDADYAAGDTATNAEAAIAQLVQQGKLYGLGGLSSTGLTDQSNTTANRGLDLNAINSATGNQLGALAGKTSAYGATPGLANTFGNQVLQSGQQGIQIGGLQNALAQMIINGQLGKASVPGDFQSAMGNIGSVGSLIGNGLGAFASGVSGGLW